MSGDNDVRKCKEALEHVISNDFARQITEEDICLLLIDVDGQAAELTALEGLDRRFGVDQPATAGINQ